jgi:uncharacterized protein YbjT (DUF2867 family)
MKVLVSGASGLVGSYVLNELLNDNRVTLVYSLVRNKSVISHPKLIEAEVVFQSLQQFSSESIFDIAFCCLGTTLKKAGSKSKQFQIDHDYVVNFAQLANEKGVKSIGIVSSIGSKTPSSNFYLDTKGQMETHVIDVGIEKTIFIRPSFLFGKRKEFRFWERVGVGMMKVIGFLFIGSARKYRGVEAEAVARTLIRETVNAKNGVTIVESDAIVL